jgi:NhaB family Na+:H+ antiporter
MIVATSLVTAMAQNFLGSAPLWYKRTILVFLVFNPVCMVTVGPFLTGWLLIAEFIFTLAMALKCYPLPAGGLLVIEAVVMGMTSAESVYLEAEHNFQVILLLIFMVAGIHFMKDLLQFTFTRILVRVQSKILISLLFCAAGAFLSAFLDALTVTAVVIAVAFGFYNIYHRYASGLDLVVDHNLGSDALVGKEQDRADLLEFRGFLRNIVMHAAVGTALGGVCTLVGEPQNLLVGSEMGWHFGEFFVRVAPVSMPVLVVGLVTCVTVERFRLFTYGFQLPGNIRSRLLETATDMEEKRGVQGRAVLVIQGLTALWLILGLAFHMAEVGIIGLSVIILLTSLNGLVGEHQLGQAFEEALPFTALLVVFFAVVAVIHTQHLFAPLLHAVLSLQGQNQLGAYYAANGLLSSISDNVFVATVYITETKLSMAQALGSIHGIQMTGQQLMAALTDPTTTRAAVLAQLPAAAADQAATIMHQFDKLAVAINTGTNIPSVATPNGQAAFLFLLTSALAPVLRLSYGRMVLLALPYTLSMTLTGFIAVWYMNDVLHFFGM